MSTETEAWRAMIDPFSLRFHSFRLDEILDYPHAGNDVFHVRGQYQTKPCDAYLKVERQSGADIRNEIEMLQSLPFPLKPCLLDYSLDSPVFVVTMACPGKRLSQIVAKRMPDYARRYMKAYGKTMAQIHQINISAPKVKHRRFFEIPVMQYAAKYNLLNSLEYLQTHTPEGETQCFVHGDFHYANILWNQNKITAVLDYELAGYGMREFDIAWALVLRPGQAFLQTIDEIRLFLEGYGEEQIFSTEAFQYEYIKVAMHFYALGDVDYQRQLRQLIQIVMQYNRL
jgi:aminoglycoside phosphotransferase (APT) family kinase protein